MRHYDPQLGHTNALPRLTKTLAPDLPAAWGNLVISVVLGECGCMCVDVFSGVE